MCEAAGGAASAWARSMAPAAGRDGSAATLLFFETNKTAQKLQQAMAPKKSSAGGHAPARRPGENTTEPGKIATKGTKPYMFYQDGAFGGMGESVSRLF